MGRLLLFGVGVAVGVWFVVKGRSYFAKKVPEAVANKLSDSATQLVDRAATFASDVRTAMAERERELRDSLGMVEPTPDTESADTHVPQRAADL